jgi:RNA polymerase sigma-70 factor (ECF subfamily)
MIEQALELRTVELIRECQAGSEEALRTLIERYQGRVAAIVATEMGQSVGVLADAEDIIQEALVQGFRGLDHFTVRTPGGFYIYMSECVRSAIARAARSEGAQKRGRGTVRPLSAFDYSACLFPNQDPTPSALLRRKERSELVRQALFSLNERDRQILVDRYFKEMSISEIAQSLGLTANTASQACARARARLKELLPADVAEA